MDDCPRVTQVIGHFLGIPDVDMSRGSAVHKACELWDKNDLDESTVVPKVRPYLEGYKKFHNENAVSWCYIEQEIYHPNLRYKGRLDRAGFVNSKAMIVDLKSNQATKGVELQLAAYLVGLLFLPDFKEKFESEFLEKRALILKPYNYQLTQPYMNRKDFMIFSSMLTIYNWKQLYLGR